MPGPRPRPLPRCRKAEAHLFPRKGLEPMQIAIWILLILIIAALIKYLLGDAGRK